MADDGIDDGIDDDLARELYAVGPDEFLAKRSALVSRLKDGGDAKAAAAVGNLRKPTVAAWIVNAFVLEHPDEVDRLADVGDRLRAAQHQLEAPRLRELSQQRRALVSTLTKQAFQLAGRAASSTTLWDEVHGTFDAAVADPAIAARLGRLQRPEQFSGFGFAAGGPPQLTLVRGGRDRDGAPVKKPAKAAKRNVAQERARQRALTRARGEFEQAEAAVGDAQRDETEAGKQVKSAERALAQAKDALEAARRELDEARETLRAAKDRRRETRRSLDRAEREAENQDA